MTVSVLLATADRPDQAERFVHNLRETTQGHDVEIVAAVDGAAGDALALSELGCVVDYSKDYRGASRAWNAALEQASGDPLVLAADDLHFNPGWLDAALEQLAEFDGGWGLVGFNDGHWGAELATHYLMSRRFVVEVLGGVIAWECYGHSFNDVEANERAKAAGRYSWCEEARVDHVHWLFGDRQQDDTDIRGLQRHSAAQAAFQERQAAGFPDEGITPVLTTWEA